MRNVTQKLIEGHLVEGDMTPGAPIALRIDQTLTQDATGTLVMLALEQLDPERVATELSVQYVDHNLLQTDNRNADDHLFLETACRRYGVWFSRAGNGVSHPLHMAYFGRPGASLLGSDSHTPAAGALGMLAIGAGGLDVAVAMAGEPFRTTMPEVWGVRLTGTLPDWVSAKDVVLEMLRRHGVSGGAGRIIEYHGPGLEALGAMDRHVIANMGTELGATTTVFPADAAVRDYLERNERSQSWEEILADDGAGYDVTEEIDLSMLEPLIAKPSSPANVVPVREVAGEDIAQSYIGSSANPGFRDFAVVAEMVAGRRIADGVSLDINPTSRDVLGKLTRTGHLAKLIASGARLHQAGCNGCIGMGQAPAIGRNSLRTVPRNFPDRSGTPEDSVFLCSPETAAASALTGRISDPRKMEMEMDCPTIAAPPALHDPGQFLAPLPPEEALATQIVKGPGIDPMPEFEAVPDHLELPILLSMGDDISTDEIMPAGAEILPFRSSIQQISEFAFRVVDEGHAARARDTGNHAVAAGENYGQGSSREHAAVAPRHLGMRAVLAKSFSRIHRANLVNYGVLPLLLDRDQEQPAAGSVVVLDELHEALDAGAAPVARIKDGDALRVELCLSPREASIVRAGGLMNRLRENARKG